MQGPIRPGYRGLLALCRALGEPLPPFQRTIARAVLEGTERQVVAVLPRGHGKSTLAAKIALHHVLTTDRPSVYVGAASREQARTIWRIVERHARRLDLQALGLVLRHDELRTGLREPVLQVVASDGAKALGWERPTLLIGDEAAFWSASEPSMLGTMSTSMIKNRESRMLLISTPSSRADSPLSALRVRALGQTYVKRTGCLTEATDGARGIRWLEWGLEPGEDPDDMRHVKRANPAPWITLADLTDQHARTTAVEWAAFHAGLWHIGDGAWLPPAAWSACLGPVDLTPREVVLAADIGGTRSASALIGVDPRTLEVPICEVFTGDDSVLRVTDAVLRLRREGWTIRELAYDPWRFASEALRLEREHRVRVVAFPQSHSRMVPASEGLHGAIVEKRLRHPGHVQLDRHVANAVALRTGRGWRLEKATHDAQIDAVVSLAMAVERAQAKDQKIPRFIGVS